MSTRGTYQFEIHPNGNLVDNHTNVEKVRKLFTDGQIIRNCWGPGDPGDFDYGGWHCLCHLAAGSGAYKKNGSFVWAGIIHAQVEDRYLAALSSMGVGGEVLTVPLASAPAKSILGQANLLGYIEGTSAGHISARGVDDPPEAFNNWPRQVFDQPVGSGKDGGTIWEHWCTTRDLRPSNPVSDSVLRACVTLVSSLGGQFAAAVTRGRRSYNHPVHLCALVKAGFISREDALWDTSPIPIPPPAERLFQEARPVDSIRALQSLPWQKSGERAYFMFECEIGRWSRVDSVRSDLNLFN